MNKKFVVKGCPFIGVAHYAQGDTVEDQCGLTEYELCVDREDCFLRKVASEVIEDNTEKVKELLQTKYTTVSFKF